MESHRTYNIDLKAETTEFFKPLEFNLGEINYYILWLKKMLTIRLVEDKLAYHKKIGDIKGPVHLGAGQEAIAVGVSHNLKKNDQVFGAHRSHAHLIALGSNIRKLFAEILGRSTGHSKGMGGSMHLQDIKSGFYGSVPIVSGTIPIAVGAALASKIEHRKSISVAYFGDGAVEEGVFHESLNLAKVLNCPVLFICENNLFSSHMHISERQPFNSVSRFAIANGINYRTIDGNNIIQCVNAAKEMINLSRDLLTPTFIEAITFRHYGHVDWREDIDVGVNRSKKDLEIWKNRDPIKRLKNLLFEKGILNSNEFEVIKNDIQNHIDISWEKAINDPVPKEADLYKYLYYDE